MGEDIDWGSWKVAASPENVLDAIAILKTKIPGNVDHEDFGTEKCRRLGITRSGTTTYTNTGLLLSDQCRHTIKTAVFEDPARTLFHNRREFQGSVAAQFEDAFAFLDLNNATHAEIHAAYRANTETIHRRQFEKRW